MLLLGYAGFFVTDVCYVMSKVYQLTVFLLSLISVSLAQKESLFL